MHTIKEVLDFLNIRDVQEGLDFSRKVNGLAFSVSSTPDKVMVVHQASMLEVANKSSSQFIFLDISLKDKFSPEKSKFYFFVKNPYLIFAKLSQFFNNDVDFKWSQRDQIHPSSVVDESLEIGAHSTLGPNTTIYPNVKIGSNTHIMAGSILGQNVEVGNNCKIFPNVTIYPNTTIGNNVRIHSGSVLGSDGFGYAKDGTKNVKIQHSGKLIISDDVEIGASTAIDRGTIDNTVIEKGVVIDNNVQIGHNCKIGPDSVICGMVGITGGVTIGKCVTVGGLTGFNNHVQVGDFSQIGGMTAVSKDLPPNSKVIGRPMKNPMEYHRLQVLVGKLPEIYKELKELKSELVKK